MNSKYHFSAIKDNTLFLLENTKINKYIYIYQGMNQIASCRLNFINRANLYLQ